MHWHMDHNSRKIYIYVRKSRFSNRFAPIHGKVNCYGDLHYKYSPFDGNCYVLMVCSRPTFISSIFDDVYIRPSNRTLKKICLEIYQLALNDFSFQIIGSIKGRRDILPNNISC